VFDRDLFSLSSNSPGNFIQPTPLPEPFTAEDPPRTLSSDTDLKAWQSLFKARRDWAVAILQKSQSLSRTAQRYFEDQGVIDRAGRIAVGNHDIHIKNLEQKHLEARSWYDDVSKEQEDNVRTWERDFSQLEYLPAKREFLRFITKGVQQGQNGQRASPTRVTTLKEYMDYEAVRKASSVSRKTNEAFGTRLSSMGSQIEKIGSDYQELLGAVDQSQSRSAIDDVGEPQRLLDEIEAVVKKVDSDYEHVLSLPANPKSIAQVSKMALLHTRNYLPAVLEYSAEMGDLVRRSVEQKNASVANAVESMRGIATIESIISTVDRELKKLDFTPEGLEAFELMSLVSRIPFVYGSLLIEAVRRNEWLEKMKKDSSALAEEMAGFQDEEERRRKRWLKPIQDLINAEAVQGNILGLEMNIQGEKQSWPVVTREEVQEYLQVLQTLERQESSVGPLIQAFKDIDKPTKQQVKRAKGFKAGSVHEGAFGKGSLLLRGDDEARVFKEANLKLEEELKGSKSRVRRLEDLLHRQSTLGRLSIGSGFQPGPQSPAEPSTPNPDRPPNPLSRRSSVSSRRFSSNQGPDEKALTRRILKLEAELAAEKEAVANLQKEARSRNDEDGDLKRQMEETKLTKKDLMENMEAQQKEFAEERRSLEDELAKYKLKVEDAEDDLDRVLGSREHERASTDTKIQSLEAEVDQVRHEATEEVRSLVSHIKNLESDLQQREDLDAQRRTSLVTVHKQLSSEKTAPEDHDQLISQLEDLASRSVTHLQDLTQAVAIAKSENQAIRSRAEKMESELTARIDGCETERNSLREQLDIEKAKAVSIKAKLEEQHGHLEDLRTKFAEGETGSEALRQRVSEEESQVEKLSTQLAESKSHAISLDVALMALQKQISKDSETDASRLQKTASRAKEVSRRLYGVHERLLRLLEAFGFLVSYEGETMLLQRASRASASTMLIDPSNSINRSVTTPSPTPLKMHLEDLGDLTFLQWPETDDAEEETQRYKELTRTLDQFDLEMFCEAVMKRMRDMEHTARKFQKETRAYREKYHRAQSEAHEKIAFRSFKDGDLALFLPTRNQATRPWAAFNVGAPHYFLREQDSHKLHGREWLVARISKVEERVVDLSKAMESARISSDSRSITSGVSYEDDNPFELSDGLRWYLLDAAEEKAGAPSTPGLGKTTVASAHVDAKGSIRMTKKFGSNGPTKTLNKSLDSRRSSANSRKSVPTPTGRQGSSEAVSLAEGADSADGHNSANPTTSSLALGTSPNSTGPGPSHLRSHTETEASASSAQPAPERSRIQEADEVRKDLLWGP
jgi:autophagy-related protein 11